MRTKLHARLDEKWPDINEIRRIQCIRENKFDCSREVLYLITSALPDKFDAVTVPKALRDHRGIVICAHCIFDVTFKEHASRIRTGALPGVMDALHSSVLALIHRAGQRPTGAKPAHAARLKASIKPLLRT